LHATLSSSIVDSNNTAFKLPCRNPSASSGNVTRSDPTRRKWLKPDLPYLKVNSDASLKNCGTWGLGAIIRNENGLSMAAATWNLDGFDDVATTEAAAILHTMKLARDCGFRNMIFESDSEVVVRLLQREDRNHRSYLGLMVREMLCLRNDFDSCCFSFSHRSTNGLTHSLAQLAHSAPNKVWIEDVPQAITSLYSREILY